MVKYRFNEYWDDKQKKFKENIIGLTLGSSKTPLIAGTNLMMLLVPKCNNLIIRVNQQPRLFIE